MLLELPEKAEGLISHIAFVQLLRDLFGGLHLLFDIRLQVLDVAVQVALVRLEQLEPSANELDQIGPGHHFNPVVILHSFGEDFWRVAFNLRKDLDDLFDVLLINYKLLGKIDFIQDVLGFVNLFNLCFVSFVVAEAYEYEKG